ncbi:HEAT repeat domain-containing protein [Natrinema zhouii]|uniref:HEAT repeat domain-containing protein n=1 Tax=Natrinema zhouii TaxID=1710539 RepID=A0A7D6CNZ3_9EURY|nr:HEAT repeat domain-containing protein [Natrinema zhouii]QLK26337.1 HEAT repeat domain-containing protein [Natrinema zhouii]
MTMDSSVPLDGIDPESITRDDIDDAELRAALSSSDPLVRQRGIDVCETLAEEGVDAVRPVLDEVASLANDDNSPIALRAITVLRTVAERDPGALEGRLTDLVDTAGADIVDVQLTGSTVLAALVVERPDLVAPFVRQLLEGIRVTEPDPQGEDLSDVVTDEVTRRTIQDHEDEERKRRISARQTLSNVVVAAIESEPQSAFDAVDALVALLDDAYPAISGGAIDALAQLAAAKPAVVAPVRDRLIDCLDDDSVVVRARTVRALGHLGDDAAVPKLRDVAATDANRDVRELADETANFLANAS